MRQHISLVAPDRYQTRGGNRQTVIVAQAQELMAADPSAPHRIIDLAAVFGISPFHLAHVFRARVGVSVHQYLLRVRLDAALERLRRGEASLSRLAADLGFSSHSHFTAVFRKHFGIAPAEWRATVAPARSSCEPDSISAGAA
jgi:AraC-like DNA-binding protein